MAADARFEDGGEKPLKLIAEDAEDLSVIAALVQDAILPASEMQFDRSKRQFSFLINRFRWEDKVRAERGSRAVERVRAVLLIDDVTRVQTQGLAPKDDDTVLSILTIEFEAGDDGTGRIVATLAGDGAIGLDVETINVTLQDVTRPYTAPSGKTPAHPAD